MELITFSLYFPPVPNTIPEDNGRRSKNPGTIKKNTPQKQCVNVMKRGGKYFKSVWREIEGKISGGKKSQVRDNVAKEKEKYFLCFSLTRRCMCEVN